MRLLGVLAIALLVTAPAAAQTPKPGGVINLMQREELAVGFAIHETATIATIWPALPCFNNLVVFDQLKRVESVESVVGELAEKWSWQDGYRNLVFFLRKDVRWHDGKPFTSKDVKFTFDMIREVPEAQAKLRTNPRKDWYANVEAVEAAEPYTVVFRLKRPQPSMLLMLASGQSPVYPAHVPPAEHRNGCVGTGPFKLKEWRKGEFVEYVKNRDYFVKGRPYLDGLKYLIISERGTRTAAIQSGRLDASSPGETTRPISEQLKAAVPGMVITPVGAGTADNLLINATRPPFNDLRVRRALSFAIDRHAYVRSVAQGGAAVGAALAPRPYGLWGLSERDLAQLPGYGNPAEDKAKARKLLAEAGFNASNPLRAEVLVRGIASYIDFASFVISELRQVGVEGTLKQVDTVQWYGLLARKEYQIGANISGFGLDDPDANFYENFSCTSIRNYTGYCNEQVMKLMDQQSQELDQKKRLMLVQQILRKLEEDAARPMMGWRLDYHAQWPHVKNLVPHHYLYSYGRMQEVWLDK
jgi:peptide/nickel transport system substrate-binding protein